MNKEIFLAAIGGRMIDVDKIPLKSTWELSTSWQWWNYEGVKIVWGKSDWWCAIAIVCLGIPHAHGLADCDKPVNPPTSTSCILFCSQVAHGGLDVQDSEICLDALNSLPFVTGEIYPTDDAKVSSLHPNANFGDDESLSVLKQRRDDGSIWVQMSFLRFQLSEPLPDYIVLHIKCTGDYLVQNHNVRIGKPNADWDEDTITWNTKPLSTTKETISTNDIKLGWNEITINPSLYHLGSGVISIVLDSVYIAEFGTTHQASFDSKEDIGDEPYLAPTPVPKLTITFVTNPSGAKVYIDGDYKGIT